MVNGFGYQYPHLLHIIEQTTRLGQVSHHVQTWLADLIVFL
jgi:hypothetical protein